MTATLPWSTRTSLGVPRALELAATMQRKAVLSLLDCCDPEATAQGTKGEDDQALVPTAVENRFGRINTQPKPIE